LVSSDFVKIRFKTHAIVGRIATNETEPEGGQKNKPIVQPPIFFSSDDNWAKLMFTPFGEKFALVQWIQKSQCRKVTKAYPIGNWQPFGSGVEVVADYEETLRSIALENPSRLELIED